MGKTSKIWPDGRVGSHLTYWPCLVDFFPTNYNVDMLNLYLTQAVDTIYCDGCGAVLECELHKLRDMSHLGYWGSLVCEECKKDPSKVLKVLKRLDYGRRDFIKQGRMLSAAQETSRGCLYVEGPKDVDMDEFMVNRNHRNLWRYTNDCAGAAVVRQKTGYYIIARAITVPECVTRRTIEKRIRAGAHAKNVAWRLYVI